MKKRKSTQVRIKLDSYQRFELLTYTVLTVFCGMAFCVLCYLTTCEGMNYLHVKKEYTLVQAQRQPIMIKLLENYRKSQRLDTDKEFVKSLMKGRQGYVEQGETSLAIEWDKKEAKKN